MGLVILRPHSTFLDLDLDHKRSMGIGSSPIGNERFARDPQQGQCGGYVQNNTKGYLKSMLMDVNGIIMVYHILLLNLLIPRINPWKK